MGISQIYLEIKNLDLSSGKFRLRLAVRFPRCPFFSLANTGKIQKLDALIDLSLQTVTLDRFTLDQQQIFFFDLSDHQLRALPGLLLGS
jgi:hypothetical protein